MITKFVVVFLTAEQKSNTVRTTNPHSLTLPPVPAYYKMGFLTTNPHTLTLPPVPAYYTMGFLTINPRHTSVTMTFAGGPMEVMTCSGVCIPMSPICPGPAIIMGVHPFTAPPGGGP